MKKLFLFATLSVVGLYVRWLRRPTFVRGDFAELSRWISSGLEVANGLQLAYDNWEPDSSPWMTSFGRVLFSLNKVIQDSPLQIVKGKDQELEMRFILSTAALKEMEGLLLANLSEEQLKKSAERSLSIFHGLQLSVEDLRWGRSTRKAA